MGSFVHVVQSTWTGFRRRCPRCRRGRMYSGFYGMRRSCADCGHQFEPSVGEFTGALMLMQGGVMTIGGVGFLLLWSRASPRWLQYAWLGFWMIVVPILFYPNVKGAWLGFLHGVRTKPPA